MATTQIRLSDDNLLAEYVEVDKFKGVLEQRLMVGPDLLAMLIRDGQIAEAAPGGHFSVGGVWRTIKDSIGGQHALRLLIADLKPFQLTVPATALTKDNVPVAGEFIIELQVNPEKPANVLGLMKEHSAVTKTGVLNRLSPHLGERVLSATVRRVDALELRGNVGMQDKIQADAMKEVERIASDIGLLARVVTVRWAFNEEEQALVAKRQREREQEALEREFKILNREVEREAESTIVSLKTDLDVEKVKAATEAELRRLILSNELDFVDARETGVRVQQMKALQHELDLNRTQRLDGLQAQIEAENHLTAVARARLERGDVDLDAVQRQARSGIEMARIEREIRSVKRETEELDAKQRVALKELEEEQVFKSDRRNRRGQLDDMETMQDLELKGARGHTETRIFEADAESRRKIEEARQAAEAKREQIEALRNATPEQILAINAGFSKEVVAVLIEQARAKAAEGADRIALMREMVDQAKEARVESAAQARHLFDSGMQGAAGVAQGVGMAAAAAGGGGIVPMAGGMGGTTECPQCHTIIPASDRFCLKCGRQMRQ